MLTDVIAALATPPGRSAVALIRVSGREAHAIGARVLQGFTPDPPRVARVTHAFHPSRSEPLDQVLYVAYRTPASFTGEDMLEISTHGGLLVPGEVLGALFAAGARQAAPGEFTRRALANGKLDLVQAEGIADLVDASAPAQRRAALHQLDRGLSQRIAALREQVLALETLVCYEIDFPEEDSGPIPEERITHATHELAASLSALIRTASEGERLRAGALVVIAGRPNAGKSSLFNALLGTERAIVTAFPGTTRDAIEAPATCGGFPFRLVDTAGLRQEGDSIERLGIEVSRRYLARADLVLFCVETGRPLDADEQSFLQNATHPVVLVRTKADLDSGTVEGAGSVSVAALTGQGIPELRARLAQEAFSTLAGADDVEPLITRERHRVALERAGREVELFGSARATGLEVAVAATHLRAAVTALEDVIGTVTSDDVLDRVFRDFCVGK